MPAKVSTGWLGAGTCAGRIANMIEAIWIGHYEGFNVEESFRRSKVWLEVADIDFKRIGNPEYWATVRERIL